AALCKFRFQHATSSQSSSCWNGRTVEPSSGLGVRSNYFRRCGEWLQADWRLQQKVEGMAGSKQTGTPPPCFFVSAHSKGLKLIEAPGAIGGGSAFEAGENIPAGAFGWAIIRTSRREHLRLIGLWSVGGERICQQDDLGAQARHPDSRRGYGTREH